jgi:hypothetical protein
VPCRAGGCCAARLADRVAAMRIYAGPGSHAAGPTPWGDRARPGPGAAHRSQERPGRTRPVRAAAAGQRVPVPAVTAERTWQRVLAAGPGRRLVPGVGGGVRRAAKNRGQRHRQQHGQQDQGQRDGAGRRCQGHGWSPCPGRPCSRAHTASPWRRVVVSAGPDRARAHLTWRAPRMARRPDGRRPTPLTPTPSPACPGRPSRPSSDRLVRPGRPAAGIG